MMGDKIDDFVASLMSTPGVRAMVDRSDDPAGVSFIDISVSGVDIQVSFQPLAGFGLFFTADAFGQRPDLLIQDPASAATRVLETLPLPARIKIVAGQ